MSYPICKFEERHKEDIVEIARSTWGGHDHLVHAIDEWISNPMSHLFVMEHEEHAIAFAAVKLIEDGKTGWLEGLRVHPDYRQRGLAWAMTEHLVKAAKELGVQRLRLTTAVENEAPAKIARKIGMNDLFELDTFWIDGLTGVNWEYNEISTNEVDTDSAIQDIESIHSVLLNGVLIQYWYALDATESAIREIGEYARFWVGRKDSCVVSFSLGYERESRVGPEWSCTIYANDRESFLSALSVQLKEAKAHNAGLMCIHPTQFKPLYDEVEWLSSIRHKICMALFEKVL